MTTFIQEQNEIRPDYVDENANNGKRRNWRTIVCNTSIQGWIFIATFAIVVPFLTYYVVVDRGSYKIPDTFTCYVNQTFRVSCGVVNITEKDCVTLACCYDQPTQKCYHYLPSRYSYDLSRGRYQVSRTRSPIDTTGIETMYMSINEINADQVSITLHEGKDQVPEKKLGDDKNYVVKKTAEKLMVEIYRPNGDLLLSTAKGPLIASDNYWEWTVYLTSHSIFGIDRTLITPDGNSTFSKVFYNSRNDHNSLPLLWAYTKGKFHGIVINHDGPMELTVLSSNLVVLKSLTGGSIEIVLSVGPTPKLLHDQQLQRRVVESDSLPYWVLGTHVCSKQKMFYNMSYLVESFTLDSHADTYCIDDNLFMYLLRDYKDGINSSGILNELLTQLSNDGKKFLLSISPQILDNTTLYQTAEDNGLLYKFNESIYKGEYLKENVSYPDYSHPQIQAYIKEIDDFLLTHVNVSIDGLILKDNWPANDHFVMDNVSFPYFNRDFQDAMSGTIPWNATGYNNTHIFKHNLYGPSQYDAFTKYYNSINQSKVIMSATKSLTQIEPTIVENIDVSWDNLRHHLVNLLFNSASGNHLVGLPVCGDTTVYNETLQESLCLRWYIIAATMPLFRLSSPLPLRNPDGMVNKYAQKIAANMLEKRRMLLPYYYALIVKNEPVMRPMFYDYYENTTTFNMKSQYMIGERLLVAHPLSAEKTKLQVYLPPRILVWYELWGGEVYKVDKKQNSIKFDVRDTDFLAFIAQGTIVPLVNYTEINLIIALNCTKNVNEAEGSIQIEDININFQANDQFVTVNASAPLNYTLGYIHLYHYSRNMSYSDYHLKHISLFDNSIIHYEEITTTEPSTSTTSEVTTAETTTETTTEPVTSQKPSSTTTNSGSTSDSSVTTPEAITTPQPKTDGTSSNPTSTTSATSETVNSDSTITTPEATSAGTSSKPSSAQTTTVPITSQTPSSLTTNSDPTSDSTITTPEATTPEPKTNETSSDPTSTTSGTVSSDSTITTTGATSAGTSSDPTSTTSATSETVSSDSTITTTEATSAATSLNPSPETTTP